MGAPGAPVRAGESGAGEGRDYRGLKKFGIFGLFCFNAGKAASRTARALRSGLSVWESAWLPAAQGRERGRTLGGIFTGQIDIPVWLRGWPISQQIRLLCGISNKTAISEP